MSKIIERAYLVSDKNLGCRVLRFDKEWAFICPVDVVEDDDAELYSQFSTGALEGDVLFSHERRKNYKIVKIVNK